MNRLSRPRDTRFRNPSALRLREKRRRLTLESLERRQLLAADSLRITVENLSDEGGLASTPFWIAAHDGHFDLGDIGASAAGFAGLELLAEEGDVSELAARFSSEGIGNDAVVLAPDGFPGAPVFEPGETVSVDLVVDDTSTAQYFSFASMVIPSNDAFVANLDPLAFRLFGDAGEFIGPRSIVVYGSNVYDAGTEVNDATGGAAFSTEGGSGVDENGTIQRHLGLDEFVGTGLPTGNDLAKSFGENTPIARITISRTSSPSNPIDASAPKALLHAIDLDTASDFHEITVVYSDPSGVDPTSIDVDDLRVTGPLLTQLDVLSVATDAAPGTTPHEVTATYRVAPDSGAFTSLDNGTYSVVLLADEVNDPFGHASDAQLLGDFRIDAPLRLQISYENLSDDGGLAQTPLWIAAHNGNFELARAGAAAADFGGLELLAEEGDPSEIAARFAAESDGVGGVIFAPDGFPGAPVFEPGETAEEVLEISDPMRHRFFSFASMIIPSNDAFIANLDPRGIELFDRFGDFVGARTITIYGRDVWDTGTEVNDATAGAAFSTLGGVGVDENGFIHRHDGLDNFIGTGLPTGDDLGQAFADMTPIGRITISLADIVAEPIDVSPPKATLDVSSAVTAGQSTHPIRVTYSDPSGVDLTSIDLNDIHVVSGIGDPLEVVSVTVDAIQGSNPKSVTATYEVAPVDGDVFSTFDNNLYFVNLNEAEVGDTFGNEITAQSIGSFEVRLPVELQITIENLSVEGGLAQTPFWVAVHEGNFQVAAAGQSASDFGGLEDLAEEGDINGLSARFAAQSNGVDGVVVAPGGFAGAPVFEPGEIDSQVLEVFDTNANRFFSFASMVIPSNDAFVANFNPRAYELFDDNGFFLGQRTITLTGRDIWDAGTEVNSETGGAAFSALGGVGMDEGGVIHRHSGLDEFIATPLPTGDDLLAAFDSQTPIARITINLLGASSQPADETGPIAEASATSVVDAGAATHEIQITYNDPSGVDLTTIDSGDIRISGPLGNELSVVSATPDASIGSAPQTVNVIYTVVSPDGEFTAAENGRYTIELQPAEVTDTLGIENARETVGVFSIDVGVRLQVEIESLTSSGGLAKTPFWIGFHNGDFEVARSGLAASQFGGLELIAETGDPSELVARFASQSDGTDTVITAPNGFPGAPVFEPGESVSEVIEVEDTANNRYFSFASMIIPSNDAFVANRDPRAYELFDQQGNFQGAIQITLYGRDILDAGTEVNDAAGGAAYSTEGGTSVDENGVIHRHTGLDEFVGTGLPTGEDLQSAFSALTPIATITISLFDPEAPVCSGVTAACSARSVSLQNAQLSADVNRDGLISPLDALLVINFLGRFGNTETIAAEAQATGLDLDVGGNFIISPDDALIVINEIDRLSASRLEPEGERTNPVDAVFLELGAEISGFDDDESPFAEDRMSTLF